MTLRGRAVARGAMLFDRRCTAKPKHATEATNMHEPPAKVKPMLCSVVMMVSKQFRFE
jgi:hypothetical protein